RGVVMAMVPPERRSLNAVQASARSSTCTAFRRGWWRPVGSAPVALTKTAVVDTALEILRESGLPGMSMRTLAGRLHVQPSALYWHVPSKQALLTAVAERILATMGAVGAAETAGAELRVVATALRTAVTAYPDGAEIVALGLAAG